MLLFAAGRPKLGLARLQSTTASRAGNLEDLIRLLNEGAASGEAGQFDSAIRALTDALRIALGLQKLERFADAVRDFEQSAKTYGCIGKADKQADALVMHAQALEQMGLLSESFASMKAALALMQSTNYEGQYEIKAVAEVVRRMREDLGKVFET